MTIDLRGLKKWVRENYLKNHPLQVIQQEPDKVTFEEYKQRGIVWLRLSKIIEACT